MVGWCGCEGFGGQMLKGVFGCGMIGVGELMGSGFNGHSKFSLDCFALFCFNVIGTCRTRSSQEMNRSYNYNVPLMYTFRVFKSGRNFTTFRPCLRKLEESSECNQMFQYIPDQMKRDIIR